MNTATPSTHSAAGICPMHAQPAPGGPQDAPAVAGGLAADTVLVLPLHQSVVAQRHTDDTGAVELRLYHGDKEISFDEPELFAFGETLARQSRFTAHSATTWGPGYPWHQVQPLLEQLLDEGVLQQASSAHDRAAAALRAQVGERPAPLPPGPNATPRSWFDCAAVMQALVGRPLALGHLEMVVPIFRVAHMALDDDGRQVGEANVFPPALRMDIDTRWRSCIYAGTRFQTGRPMNVTALKAMRQHWPTMMVALQAVRRAYVQRCPEVRAGWTVGHLERLATAVLAVPTYQLVRADQPVRRLHPALSSLFRVTDGLRMVTHQMLFVPIGEPTLSPDAPMTAHDLMAYAERNYSLHSEHGVCAGPQAMIEEFLAVLVDGQPPRDAVVLDAAMARALDELAPAIDYALLGLQVHAAVFSVWPAMSRCYLDLLAAADALVAQATPEAPASPALLTLRERLQACANQVKTSTYLAAEQWRLDRARVYDDMYAQCGRALGDAVAADALSRALDTSLHAAPAAPTALDQRLESVLAQRLGHGQQHGQDLGHAAPARPDTEGLRPLGALLSGFLRQVQAALGVAGQAQDRINALLGRTPPDGLASAADIDIHNQLQGAASRRLPYLLTELETVLGLRLHVDARSIEIEVLPLPAAPAPAARPPDSAGAVPAECRAPRT